MVCNRIGGVQGQQQQYFNDHRYPYTAYYTTDGIWVHQEAVCKIP